MASGTTRVLVDVGLSMPALLKRLKKAEIDPTSIDAVLVTHEHIDHVLGLDVFLKNFGAHVYLHEAVVDIFPTLPHERVRTFVGEFEIGDIAVRFFPVPHDSRFCFGYTFRSGDAKVSIATDLGRVTGEALTQMAGSQIVMIECNHDLAKLEANRRYPYVLKKRIMGSHGHLSNPASALAIYQLAGTGATQFILAHLSGENNTPTLAYEFVRDFLGVRGLIEGEHVWIDVASQDEPGAPFSVD